ncbi:MAG TPA: cupin domain-containing protein [Oceanithermus profundus]|uniref:Cupin domain-containing protein n=1 Tax=Oceanithermus profundus TaxID=187137 RepID=A0A7C4V6E9_9DEIN|nr:cupin domain-containing protein [Oceanithermus profundus]
MKPEPLVRRAADVPKKPVAKGRGAYLQVLVGPDDGAPHFILRRFTLEPGGRIPAHRHPTIEHEQFVLRGRMVLGLDDEEREVAAGEAVFIPAGTVHWYENRSSEPVEFLCVIPKTKEYETEWLD